MAREQMDFLSTWYVNNVDGEENKRLRVLADHIDGNPNCIVVDLSGTPAENIPPDPNHTTCRVIADTTILDAIQADPNYPVNPGTRALVT